MKEEEKLLDYQLIATILYIVSLVISILITYNDKLVIKKKKGIFKDKTYQNITIFNRSFVVILTIVYLYISYRNLKLAKDDEEIWPFQLQLFSSELSLIGALIVLYVVLNSKNNNYSVIAGAENPIL